MSAELAYSLWHRSLGFSYFAMDVDYIEVRNNAPVALIESSLITKRQPTCKDVFNRFLQETGGFQFEIAFWVSRWLNVPAIVVCMNPYKDDSDSFPPAEPIHLLNLHTGQAIETDLSGYKKLLGELPTVSSLFNEPELKLPKLLDKLRQEYPGISNYPYFNSPEQWNTAYQARVKEVVNRVPRRKPTQFNNAPDAPVKGETTGERRTDYSDLRETISGDVFNLNWVEWRKDRAGEKIGRPAAIIKTLQVSPSDDFVSVAETAFNTFASSKEYVWWSTIAAQMLVPWHCTAYELTRDGRTKEFSGNFAVWSNVQPNSYQRMSVEEYAQWIKHL